MFFLKMRESKFNITPQQFKVLRQLAPSQHLMSNQDMNPTKTDLYHAHLIMEEGINRQCRNIAFASNCRHFPIIVMDGQV
jgi:hypothetical protein